MLIRLNDKRNMKTIKSNAKNQTVISICVHLVYVATKFKCFDYYVSWIQVAQRKYELAIKSASKIIPILCKHYAMPMPMQIEIES